MKLFQKSEFLKLDEVYKNQINRSYKNLNTSTRTMKEIEKEWAKFKYLVLEHSHKKYLEIRELLKDKGEFPDEEFLSLVVEALIEKPSENTRKNAYDHIWGYFKDKASKDERRQYNKSTDKKNYLYDLAKKYDEKYLIYSYFFIDKN